MERNERLGRCVDESEGWMAKEKRKDGNDETEEERV